MTWKRAAAVAVVVVLLAAGGSAFLPWTANHFGYALPGERGLPYRIHHAGRDYHSSATCAGAGWCTAAPYCTPFGGEETSLTRIGEVGTLFGAAHTVFTTRPVPEGTPLTVLVRAGPGCYVGYALMGGP
ncbi:hypothetical protein Q5425_36125 [Amycolatopsis sp. A133]|uniref:hypothetical protein n=1 Tax=Amycolatopsis sp. A133 TaxID=3064472 RepID=UPI0027E67CFA|nr:hypothetical protein [Amycolatopsis sp. A133]MDQ7809184.1 hypothetical protein [Amycolatopsis sp. A133]